MTVSLDEAYTLDGQVSLRPEPFGALAYHYGNRRLVFLRSTDMVRVVESLESTASVAAALEAAQIDKSRWSSFVAALSDLERSEVIHARR